MESSMNNAFVMSKHETNSDDQTPEESSWTMYFEDFFEASSSIVDVGDCSSSSSVSDAASFVAPKKTIHVSKQERSNYSNKFDIKRTRNREIPFGRLHDLEDTASSPSHSPNIYSMRNLLGSNIRHGDGIVGDDTMDEIRESAVQNEGGFSVALKEKGLCLVPMSMVTNFLAFNTDEKRSYKISQGRMEGIGLLAVIAIFAVLAVFICFALYVAYTHYCIRDADES